MTALPACTTVPPTDPAIDPHDEGFGLYVHWPWCLSKCPYCDFNSHVIRAGPDPDASGSGPYAASPRRRGRAGRPTDRSALPSAGMIDRPDQDRWARAYVRELETLAAAAPRRPLTSVFFGGGTPSLMAPATVAAVLEAAARLWPLADDIEVTLEANPGAVDRVRFQDLRAAGVSRLSLGVQALDDTALRFLGRRHDAAEALAALDLARSTFARVSYDLIYARPGQTPEAWADELGRALAFAPEHLSLYQLTIETGTAFFAAHRDGAFVLPDEDTAADLWDVTQETTAAAGLPAYEISNHARPGGECRHNLVYWRGGDYVGLGPGAHGRLGGRATRTVAGPAGWLARVERDGHGVQARERLAPADRAVELLLMGLRLTEGVHAARFERLCGRPLPETVDPEALADLTALGLVAWDGVRLRATAAGRPCLNAVLARLVR
ncbi:radical SAM family heme chaperone HemW [Roseospira goensis]|uniref:Heme chaperone HemW n=1 Tax=Roseospira goensis TaxID=391922 RepID=A0A7W6RWD1_9PROT|nr:radical SAM family heme chaperone HemW [Roseospira goensis]MBB4284436.1 oxygen-independent coproporphyrinogen-3 oxidase [Roseospira goensis]